MIQPRLSVCAETILRDAENNNISVINILEELRAVEFPVAIPKFSALFMLERDEQDSDQIDTAIVLSLDTEEIGQVQLRGDFEGKRRTRLILAAHGLVIDHPGMLTVEMVINGEMLSSWSIPIQKVDASEVPRR